MQRVIVFLVVIGMCLGCSSSQGSALDYEIRSEQDKFVSNLKVKTVEVYTDSIKEKELRRIAEDIKHENADQDAIDITFYRDKQGEGKGQSSQQQAGTAIVVNNEEAANQMLPDILFTDADRKQILNEENDGILVISLADIKRVEQEMQKETQEMQKEMEQDLQDMEKEIDKGLNEMDQEAQDIQKGIEQDLQEMEKEMEKEMPKP